MKYGIYIDGSKINKKSEKKTINNIASVLDIVNRFDFNNEVALKALSMLSDASAPKIEVTNCSISTNKEKQNDLSNKA